MNRHDATYVIASLFTVAVVLCFFPFTPLGLGLVVFVVMSCTACGLFRSDKTKAQKGARRIAEATLWFYAVLGGAVGAFIGMRRFRHKTKKLAFRFFVPLLAIVQLYALVQLAVVTFSARA